MLLYPTWLKVTNYGVNPYLEEKKKQASPVERETNRVGNRDENRDRDGDEDGEERDRDRDEATNRATTRIEECIYRRRLQKCRGSRCSYSEFQARMRHSQLDAARSHLRWRSHLRSFYRHAALFFRPLISWRTVLAPSLKPCQ